MDDKELLELAAKAAEIELGWPAVDGYKVDFGRGVWSPLTDDGDALRLAVKLKMQVSCSGRFVNVQIGREWIETDAMFENLDPYAATRRAIVRAAAEIGAGKTGEES